MNYEVIRGEREFKLTLDSVVVLTVVVDDLIDAYYNSASWYAGELSFSVFSYNYLVDLHKRAQS